MDRQRYLFEFDRKDYEESWGRKARYTVRAIIRDQDRYAMVHSEKYQEYKFPGGGMEYGETRFDTLLREVQEETGMQVIPESVRFFGTVREVNKDKLRSNMIFEQYSYFYECEVKEERMERNMDPYEVEFGYELRYVRLSDAIQNNRNLTKTEAIPWIYRETKVMELLDELDQNQGNRVAESLPNRSKRKKNQN